MLCGKSSWTFGIFRCLSGLFQTWWLFDDHNTKVKPRVLMVQFCSCVYLPFHRLYLSLICKLFMDLQAKVMKVVPMGHNAGMVHCSAKRVV